MAGYQWDQDVTGNEYPSMSRVVDAWNTALKMATVARDSIKDITPDKLVAKGQELQNADNAKRKNPRKLTDQQKKLGVRKWIAQQFPAYTQMFGAALDQTLLPDDQIKQDYGAPQLIHDRLDKLLMNLEDIDAVGRPLTIDGNQEDKYWKRNKLPLYFTKHENPHHVDGTEMCAEGTQAFVIQVAQFKELKLSMFNLPCQLDPRDQPTD